MFKHILVPMDFSRPSDAALAYARDVATRYGATLHLLHVVEDPYRAMYSAEVFVPEMEGLREMLVGEAVTQLKEKLQPSDVEQFGARTEAVIGEPADVIANYAEGRGMDLIVMGTHGRGGMAHLLMGSVAERVVRTASVPVMTVRERVRATAKAA